jgi:hypothetical protein
MLELEKQWQCLLTPLHADCGESLISEAEETNFKWATKSTHLSQTCISQFYGTYKVHKNGHRSCPTMSSVNSTPEIFSKWVDYWLKTVVVYYPPTSVMLSTSH